MTVNNLSYLYTDYLLVTPTYCTATSWGFPKTVTFHEIKNAILYKMKTLVHWAHLSVSSLSDNRAFSWQSIYRHYRKGCKGGWQVEGLLDQSAWKAQSLLRPVERRPWRQTYPFPWGRRRNHISRKEEKENDHRVVPDRWTGTSLGDFWTGRGAL